MKFFSLVQTRILQTIRNENQLLLAFQLIGPFLQRIQTESTKLLLEVKKQIGKTNNFYIVLFSLLLFLMI